MSNSIKNRLSELNLELPQPPKPAATYTPYTISGKLVYVSGQLPSKDGTMHFVGKVGQELTLEDGQKAAQMCALNILSIINEVTQGDLNKLSKMIRVGGFVNAVSDFADHPKVVNGASELFVSALGEKGIHARAAVGVGSLPFNVGVEVEAIFELA